LRHTIALTEESEQALLKIAKEGGQSADQALSVIAEALLGSLTKDVVVGYDESGVQRIHASGNSVVPVRKTLNVMGGDACIRYTRIPIWLLVQLKQAGYSEERILANYPGLTASDLIAAWDYYAAHAEQIESERRAHEEAA